MEIFFKYWVWGFLRSEATQRSALTPLLAVSLEDLGLLGFWKWVLNLLEG